MGKPLSKETREKIAASKRGIARSEETKAKIREKRIRRELEAALYRVGSRHGEHSLDVSASDPTLQ